MSDAQLLLMSSFLIDYPFASRLYPGALDVIRHMIDDKLRILTGIKEVWRDRVTTVLVRQGHYAHDPNTLTAYPAADLTVERIGGLCSRGTGARNDPTS